MAAGPSETEANVAHGVDARRGYPTSDSLVETLIDWGATYAFGVLGDGINSII